MPRRALLSLVAVLALSGCAQQADPEEDAPTFRGEQARVANTVAAFQDAADEEAADRAGAEQICRTVLAREVVGQLDRRGGCAREVSAALEDDDPGTLSVRGVEIAAGGNRATALVRATAGRSITRDERYSLVRESGTWHLAGLAG